LNTEKKIALTLFCIFFVVYVFSSDGHRHTFDEEVTLRQATWLSTLTPHPDYVPGVSREGFDFPELFIHPAGFEDRDAAPLCNFGLLCSAATIGHSIVEVPFLLLNQHLNIISDNAIFTTDDFDDLHYVWWRNSLDVNHVFLELFYGPLFTALSVFLFFFVSRTFNITLKNSIVLAFLFGFSTITWAYSQTSFSSVSMTTFILLGFLFFRKYQKENFSLHLIISGSSLGFAFLIRPDSFMILAPMFFFLIALVIYKNFLKLELLDSAKKILSFSIPLFLSYGIYQLMGIIRFDTSVTYSGFSTIITHPESYTPFYISLFGLLFSPGVGLFIFSPILFLVIVSFSDLYKKNKQDFILLLGIILSFLFWYSLFVVHWHGLSGWSARYLLPLVPFLLIPLGITLSRKLTKGSIFIICLLGGLGIIFNLVYLIQDANWFVWGIMGQDNHGLYSLHGGPLRIHPLTIWTFEFSQLTHTIAMAFIHPQLDIYLIKILGTSLYSVILVGLLSIFSYNLIRLHRSIIVKDSKLDVVDK
tara:strand:+ start:451 stop:2040 length:1590 start_codon:yes stop_codon:yes gene_type:complete